MFQVRTQNGYMVMEPKFAAPSDDQKEANARSVAKLFEPKRAVGFDKVRIGRNFDGGYIHLDDFSEIGAALSFGVNDDPSWDLDIANRGIPVHQFDPTIEKAPAEHPLISFHKVAVAAKDGPGAMCIDTIAQRCLGDSTRALLKMDIEGSEWAAFQACSPATLGRFSQVVCEFHFLERAADPHWADQFLRTMVRLVPLFQVVHVHGNNFQPLHRFGKVALPAVIEVTFANRKHYKFVETDEVFPTPLDQPNRIGVPDLELGTFKF